jgi:hypothetical protein
MLQEPWRTPVPGGWASGHGDGLTAKVNVGTATLVVVGTELVDVDVLVVVGAIVVVGAAVVVVVGPPPGTVVVIVDKAVVVAGAVVVVGGAVLVVVGADVTGTVVDTGEGLGFPFPPQATHADSAAITASCLRGRRRVKVLFRMNITYRICPFVSALSFDMKSRGGSQ